MQITVRELCNQLVAAQTRMSRKNAHRQLLFITMQVLTQQDQMIQSLQAALTSPAVGAIEPSTPEGSNAESCPEAV